MGEIIYYIFVAVLIGIIALMWWLVKAQSETIRECLRVMKDYGDITDKQAVNTENLISILERR